MNKKAANENNTKPKLETYWIPQDVYEKVMADLATPETPMSKNMDLRAKAMCLERMPINKYLRTPFTRPTLIEIAKLALEKRDWRKLYVILLQCMKTNDKLMIHEVLEVSKKGFL